jgi:hypothetical protein
VRQATPGGTNGCRFPGAVDIAVSNRQRLIGCRDDEQQSVAAEVIVEQESSAAGRGGQGPGANYFSHGEQPELREDAHERQVPRSQMLERQLAIVSKPRCQQHSEHSAMFKSLRSH